MAWMEVFEESSMVVDELEAVQVKGEKYVVYRLVDGYYATQAKCPHLGAPLDKGTIIDGCRVQCKFHHAEFDIRSGEVKQWACYPPGIQMLNFMRGEKPLLTYPCKVEKGKVFIDV